MKHILLGLFLNCLVGVGSNAQTTLSCFGQRQTLIISSTMPYVTVKVGPTQGYFVLDWGSLSTAIDTAALSGVRPVGTAANEKFLFSDFDFYGSWGTVALLIQKMGYVSGTIRQAGILGADFLSLNAFTLDYKNGYVYRAGPGQLCSDNDLRVAGFRSVSSAGYFSNSNDKLNDKCVFNVPTVPVRIGSVAAIAQLDPGYADAKHPFSVNINRALFDALSNAGITLTEIPNERIALSTCIENVTENVISYRMPAGVSFSIIGTDGSQVTIHSDAVLMLKETSDAAKSCGGIGTWKIPAAQVGASYFKEAGKMIFDPFTSRVWFGNGQ